MSDGQSERPSEAVSFPLHGDPWATSRALWGSPPARLSTLEDRVRRLEDDLALRDLLARYFDALDSGDLDAVMRCIHDDCEMVSPRGALVGRDAIRRDYENLLAQTTVRAHWASNVAIRAVGPDEAWMSSRDYGIARRSNGELIGVISTVGARLVRRDTWLIRERRVSPLVAQVLTEQALPGTSSSP